MFGHLKAHNQTVDFDRMAKSLAGIRYLWMLPEKEGKLMLTKIWDNIPKTK